LFGDDSIADNVLFVGDENDDVVTLGWPQLLKTRLGVLERRPVCDRIHEQVGFDQITTLARLQTGSTTDPAELVKVSK